MSKAQLLKSQLPDAEFANEWYDSCATTAEHFDVVLPLANECDVRSLVASRSFAVCLHATTGENWLSQLHRHIAGKDDCIACRTAGVSIANVWLQQCGCQRN